MAKKKTEATNVEVKNETLEETKKATKGRKAKKEESKPVETKPVRHEAKATAYDLRVTPRKARLVVDLVRGKMVNEALGILANVNKAASPLVAKVIKSAASNAINNFGMKEETLYVDTIYANDGVRMKRYLPRAKGRASGLVKRTCHITVIVRAK